MTEAIIRASVVYHLVDLGVEGLVVLDKGDLDTNDGSTSHAPGGLRTVTPSRFFTTLGMVGAFIAHAFVDASHTTTGTEIRVRYSGTYYTATIVKGPSFDPANTRLR